MGPPEREVVEEGPPKLFLFMLCVIVFGLPIVGTGGFYLGTSDMRTQAIANGTGKWEVNEQTGEIEFTFIDKPASFVEAIHNVKENASENEMYRRGYRDGEADQARICERICNVRQIRDRQSGRYKELANEIIEKVNAHLKADSERE